MSSSPHNDVGYKKCILDYVISHAKGDQRPYLEVNILSKPILGLLDSGANSTIVGEKGWKFLQSLGFTLSGNIGSCTVANGNSCECIGTVSVPFELEGKVSLVNVLVVPQLSHTLILGIDFWMQMGVVPDLRYNKWHFTDDNFDLTCDIAEAICDQDTLTDEQRNRLNSLLDAKFEEMGSGLGTTSVVEHEIIVDSRPIKQRYYPVSPYRQKIIDEQLNEMLENGVVEPSTSSWASPVLLVPKKDGSMRFCVDFRKLNAVTKKDAYPLPYISSILDKLGNAKYLSSLDIKSAFWQVMVSENSREYTAFTVPSRGLFQFRKMPFGLTNAPATFQRLVDRLFPELSPYVMVYLDDIIIVSDSFDKHLEVIGLVLDKLISAGLTVSKEKCFFCKPELEYLGYVVDRHGLRVNRKKVSAILDVPPPKTVKEVRSFIGLASWYRRFVPNFSTLIAPLTELTKKNVKFIWNDNCDNAFTTIKQLLVSAPILSCPDFSRPFVLQTDASSFGLGAVLTQPYEDGEKVICYLSRSLSRQERRYSVTELELLAIIFAVEKLRSYLDGVEFTVITDHSSILWLDRLQNPSGRLCRWALRLQAFKFKIIHRPGKQNVVPDFLSRSVPCIDAVCAENISDRWYIKMLKDVDSYPDKFPNWRIENGKLFKHLPDGIPEFCNNFSSSWKLVVPKDDRRKLIHENHDDVTSGHVGVYKTYWKLRSKFYWPKMRSDVSKYIRACQTCQQIKPEQKAPAGLMGTRPKISYPWQMISLDFMGPFVRSSGGYKYLLVVTDYFSKYVLVHPLRVATGPSLCKFVEEQIFLMYGVPEILICDNGSQMKSKNFQKLCSRYGCNISYTPAFYPRSDPTERTNRTVKSMIMAYVKDNHKLWDKNLASLACAIRSSKSETTGFTPFYVNFGREYVANGKDYKTRLVGQVNNSLDEEIENRRVGFVKLYEEVSDKILKAQERNRHSYNLRRRQVSFNVGDLVWRKNKVLSDASNHFMAKLAPKFVGPFVVHRKIGNVTYELRDPSTSSISKSTWHVQDLKPYVPTQVP